jgi:hypothetical protein
MDYSANQNKFKAPAQQHQKSFNVHIQLPFILIGSCKDERNTEWPRKHNCWGCKIIIHGSIGPTQNHQHQDDQQINLHSVPPLKSEIQAYILRASPSVQPTHLAVLSKTAFSHLWYTSTTD